MANRALLVGINAYPEAPLRGCVNDVEDMCNLLVCSCVFKDEEIRLLTDQRATTAAIKERLIYWLLADAQPGDRLVFHYSGHGCEITQRDSAGNVLPSNDAICPVDFDWSPEHAITAADFRSMFGRIPDGVHFQWVSDSCYSGDLARAMPPHSRHSDDIPRCYPVPLDLRHRLQTARGLGRDHLTLRDVIPHLPGALITGCATDQTSADARMGNRYCGAATYALVHLLMGSGRLKLPLSDLVVAMNDWMDVNGYPQDPQLRGNAAICAKPWLASS